MAGIYLHIPFCRQACHYCNFHFSTSLRYKNEMVAALLKEMELSLDYLPDPTIETIYFGGGTPSLLPSDDLAKLLSRLRELYKLAGDAEITLEANPDDINKEKLLGWKVAGINRLSIGVQSFHDYDLQWMNRAHNAKQALHSLEQALDIFKNISIDLIYGTPALTNEKWKNNVDTALSLGIPHLSCYALTIEPKTPLQKMINLGHSKTVDPELQSAQFVLLMDWLNAAGYEHYEISNFAKPGWRSRHNSSYWQGKPYLGLGPSAHSFDGTSRQWNIANNNKYIDSVSKGSLPFEKEELTAVQRLNEFIMISLRTMEGLDLRKINGIDVERLLESSQKYIHNGLMIYENDTLVLTTEGKLLADGIAAELFA